MPEGTFLTRLRHAWNVFRAREPTDEPINVESLGPSTSIRPDRPYLRFTNERSMVTALYTRIAIDVSSIPIKHVRLDEKQHYKETIFSGLNNILSLEANIDQASKPFLRDIIISMFDEGCVAVVPVDTTINPTETSSYDILSMRTGKILEWFPKHVRVKVYNDRLGVKQDILLPKDMVAIIENPLYSVMNEPNGTLKRLIRKLNILDAIDEQSGSGKLDLIFQMPYVIKSEAREAQALKRKKALEDQLANSKYGIGYVDATEKITQLNRPAENNLMNQITYLTSMLYSQLGITEDVFIGKADAEMMLNYQNRTIIPILTAVVEEFNRKFITKTARSQGQTIMFFQDAFRYAPVTEIADMADKFTRNAILSSNEMRSVLGYQPSSDPEADKLQNKNLNPPDKATTEDQPKLKGKGDVKNDEI